MKNIPVKPKLVRQSISLSKLNEQQLDGVYGGRGGGGDIVIFVVEDGFVQK